MSDKTQDAQRPGNVSTLRQRLRRHAMGPKGLPSIGKEMAYAITDIRQKVVEEPWFGRAVTPPPMDSPPGGIHGEPGQGGIHGGPSAEGASQGGVHGPEGPPGGVHGPQPSGDSGPTSGWDQPPTDKQRAVLARHDVSTDDMTRGTASHAIEQLGYERSWYGSAKMGAPGNGVSQAFRDRCADAARAHHGRDGQTQERPGPTHDR